MHSFLHFSRAKDDNSSVVIPKKKILMGARENECQISQSYILHMKFQEFHLCNHNSFEIWHSFCRIPMRNFHWCYYRWLITSLAFEKYEKECNILKIILVQGFFPVKIKITQFSGGFHLNMSFPIQMIYRDAASCFDYVTVLLCS